MTTNVSRGSTEKYIDDAAITTKIKAKFAADDLVKALDLHVRTEDCKVYLTGSAPNDQALKQAVKIAENTAGVKEVINTSEVVH